MRFPISLPANPQLQIGYVEEDVDGLFQLRMLADEQATRRGIHLEDYTAGPFATIEDAAMEAYSVYARVAGPDMNWVPRSYYG